MMPNLESSQINNFEEIEHTADWAYRVRGSSLADLFIQAAHGLYSLVGMQLAPKLPVTRTIKLKGIDRESLLVAWLNELLYLHESEGLGFISIEIEHLDETTLQARISGAPTQRWLKDIKAVTYHNLSIHQSESGFEVTLVLDV